MNIYTSTNSLEEFFCESIQENNNIKLKENQEKFYNYIYLDPRKPGQYCYEGLNFSFLFEPFYVGKGCNNRKFVHISYKIDKNNTYKSGKIIHILEEGYNLKEYVLQPNSNLTNQQSLDNETYIISKIGRFNIGTGPLTNLTDGGDGGLTDNNFLLKNKGKTLQEKYGENYVNPLKGKTYKEIRDENYIHPRLGKKIKDTKGEDYIDPRKGKTHKEIYGEDYINPLKGKTAKEIHGENWINPKKGKTMKEIKGEDWVNPRIGKSMKEYKGDDYISPLKGKTAKEIYEK